MKPFITAEHEGRVEHLTEEVDRLVRDAYREGVRAGSAQVTRELERYIGVLIEETEAAFAHLTPEAIEMFEGAHRTASPSPTVAARFGAMGEVLMRLHARVHQLAPDTEETSAAQ